MPSNSPIRTVAVIGAGPSGLSAVKALDEEKAFDTIRVFERRDRVGGTWLYDEIPDTFNSTLVSPQHNEVPSQLPTFTPPAPEDPTTRTGLYQYLDSNVGAAVMEFTYASIPKINSALSVRRFGHANPTRPWKVVADYLEDIFAKHLYRVSFNTTVESIRKNIETGKWDIVLRQSDVRFKGQGYDYWWTESFDAVVVATGHYSVPYIPKIPGIEEWYKRWPDRLQHSKQFRSRDAYVDKSVVVVGGSVSASDFVLDTYKSVRGSLIIAQRGENANPALDDVWKLPGVTKKPTISRFTLENDGTVEFSDGSWISGADVDVVYFATGYRLSYPFLEPNPVTAKNRLAGFYQHTFNVADRSLAVVGQIRAALSFRAYEYQAVAVARVLAGRGTLPSTAEQTKWEEDRIKRLGPTHIFHTIAPDFAEYFDTLRTIAGPPAEGSEAYELPPWEDEWAKKGFGVLELKGEYVKRIQAKEKLLAKL
ncbi:putative dimethylaniline monooxygenase [Boeremia exigua]|uniref:putative dimethylaniline monooxygenase n=1 Tax=Boeremia exigua TaxID=749465 RepID=UPI001E8DC983|nr:putative dimethylaniline monooxygenase [Boeremia exigua]KAH6625843.1 putative dimethylaniline monooxygenase [Boeremia exigua]